MSDPQTHDAATAPRFERGDRVRLIGGTPDLETALGPLPDGATITSLASESANIGVIVVTDEADLRERLFTELDGLHGAAHVWILSDASTGPNRSTIAAESELVAWHVVTDTTIAGSWLAVSVEKN